MTLRFNWTAYKADFTFVVTILWIFFHEQWWKVRCADIVHCRPIENLLQHTFLFNGITSILFIQWHIVHRQHLSNLIMGLASINRHFHPNTESTKEWGTIYYHTLIKINLSTHSSQCCSLVFENTSFGQYAFHWALGTPYYTTRNTGNLPAVAHRRWHGSRVGTGRRSGGRRQVGCGCRSLVRRRCDLRPRQSGRRSRTGGSWRGWCGTRTPRMAEEPGEMAHEGPYCMIMKSRTL